MRDFDSTWANDGRHVAALVRHLRRAYAFDADDIDNVLDDVMGLKGFRWRPEWEILQEIPDVYRCAAESIERCGWHAGAWHPFEMRDGAPKSVAGAVMCAAHYDGEYNPLLEEIALAELDYHTSRHAPAVDSKESAVASLRLAAESADFAACIEREAVTA